MQYFLQTFCKNFLKIMESTLKQRIITLMEYYNFSTPNEFAEKLGIRATKIYNVLDEKTQKSHTLIDEIANSLQEINKEWLESGKGEMMKSNNSIKEPSISYHPSKYDYDNLMDFVGKLREQRDDLQNKLLLQHEKYQALMEKYNMVKEELDELKNKTGTY